MRKNKFYIVKSNGRDKDYNVIYKYKEEIKEVNND